MKRPSRATARKLAAVWEYARPAAIFLSLALAIIAEVSIALLVTDGMSTAVSIIIAVVLFFPFWFGIYIVVAFPVNFLIGFARFEDDN